MTISWRKFLSLGVIDPKEPTFARITARVFDAVMLLVMFWLPIQWHMQLKNELSDAIISISDWSVWGLFLVEAVVMTTLVNNKKFYLQTNWLNLILIIIVFPPLIEHSTVYFAMLRYLRFLVLLRLILPQFYILHRILSRNHFGATLIVFLVVTILSGILVSFIDPNIGSPWIGIWWAWETVTTVGYGDIIPDSAAGKVFAALLMLVGVGLLSLVSANLAAYFVERGRRQTEKKPERKTQANFREIQDKIIQLDESIQRVEKLLAQQSEEPNSKKTNK